jgi:hypothetical protein
MRCPCPFLCIAILLPLRSSGLTLSHRFLSLPCSCRSARRWDRSPQQGQLLLQVHDPPLQLRGLFPNFALVLPIARQVPRDRRVPQRVRADAPLKAGLATETLHELPHVHGADLSPRLELIALRGEVPRGLSPTDRAEDRALEEAQLRALLQPEAELRGGPTLKELGRRGPRRVCTDSLPLSADPVPSVLLFGLPLSSSPLRDVCR